MRAFVDGIHFLFEFSLSLAGARLMVTSLAPKPSAFKLIKLIANCQAVLEID